MQKYNAGGCGSRKDQSGASSVDRVNCAQSKFKQDDSITFVESSRTMWGRTCPSHSIHPPAKRHLNPILTHWPPEPTHFDGCGNMELGFVVFSCGTRWRAIVDVRSFLPTRAGGRRVTELTTLSKCVQNGRRREVTCLWLSTQLSLDGYMLSVAQQDVRTIRSRSNDSEANETVGLCRCEEKLPSSATVQVIRKGRLKE